MENIQINDFIQYLKNKTEELDNLTSQKKQIEARIEIIVSELRIIAKNINYSEQPKKD